MTAAVAAAGKARVLILWLGIASLLGLHLSAGQRIVTILAVLAAVAIEIAIDGHPLWPRKANPTRS